MTKVRQSRCLIHCRVEIVSPTNDFDVTKGRVGLKGLVIRHFLLTYSTYMNPTFEKVIVHHVLHGGHYDQVHGDGGDGEEKQCEYSNMNRCFLLQE